MIRILNAEPKGYCINAREILKSVGELYEEELDREKLLRIIGKYEILIVRLGIQVDKEALDAGHNLVAVVTATTGLDHIDIQHAQKKGVKVLSLHGEADFLRKVGATAEHTWALLLALIRKVPQASRSVLNGYWDRDKFRGSELRGKRLGILGLGRLGEKIALYGNAFEMKVLAYDPFRTAWPNDVIRCSNLNALLSKSEILSIHIPLNEKTKGLIGKQELAVLLEDGILINTSRGEIVDSHALIESLSEGHLAGAAVDVIEGERNAAMRDKNSLIAYAKTHSKLLITPHIGGATWESMASTEVFMAKKLKTFLSDVEETTK
ncbi:MAG: hydroxyacid dehydrogenase [Bacteroidetes bacterium]|nr:MAG: hydroxyacid dehydrogenase [Bacteroidota bacterium]